MDGWILLDTRFDDVARSLRVSPSHGVTKREMRVVTGSARLESSCGRWQPGTARLRRSLPNPLFRRLLPFPLLVTLDTISDRSVA